MYEHKYGTFADPQVSETVAYIRKKIFYLLLYVDPETKEQYADTDVCKAFKGLLYELGGMNSVLFEPPCLVRVISILEAALLEYQKYITDTGFNFSKYRKLVLDAGNEVLKIDEIRSEIKVPDKVKGGE